MERRDEGDAERRLTLRVGSLFSHELYEGVARSQTPEPKRERILGMLETKHVVSTDHTVMRKVGKLSGELIDGEERIDREDCIIAATVLLNDEPVITRNTEHFGRIDGLEVRSY